MNNDKGNYKGRIYTLVFGCVIAFLTIISLPDYFPQYKIELIEKVKKGMNQSYFNDFDKDGKSEHIYFQFEDNLITFPTLVSRNYNTLIYAESTIKHFALPRAWVNRSRAVFADINKDGTDEIYFFSRNVDSLFLDCNYFPTDSIKSKFIAVVSIKDNKEDFQIFSASPKDINYDGHEELIFVVTDGWKAKHRALYVYDIFNDTLFESPKMFVNMQGPTPIYSSKIKKSSWILVNTYASMNCKDDYFNGFLNDSNSYIMLFDQKLNFSFNPIINKGKSSSVNSCFYEDGKSTRILSLLRYFEGTFLKASLQLTDIDGNILRKQQIEPDFTQVQIFNIKNTIFVLKNFQHLDKYDCQLALLDKETLQFKAGYLNSVDINLDGLRELIFRNLDDEVIIISKEDFSCPVKIPFPYDDPYIHYTIKLNGNKDPYISFDTSKHVLNYHYFRNPYYNFKYLFFVAIFLVSYLILFFFFKIRNETYLRREKQLAKLQYLSIKNQIDPHFTLNVLNSVSEMFREKDFNEADQYMIRFSRLIYRTLMNSNSISIKLKEELEFSRDFIEIQKTRYLNCFDYFIEIDDGVDLSIEIPRMLIHSFVENAIKHGLVPKQSNGILKIGISNQRNIQIIKIRDNGIGITNSGVTSGTGKGVKIVDQILELYRKLTSKRISYEIIDLGQDSKKEGTLIKIVIPI